MQKLELLATAQVARANKHAQADDSVSTSFLQDRREFLARLGALTAGVCLAPVETAFAAQQSALVPRRRFGRHDIRVSSIGLGGFALATAGSQADSNRIMDEALDAGVNFMDNCWDYHAGRGEEVMGAALLGKRDKAFLMTKVCPDGVGGPEKVMSQLEDSLRRLRTDHLDLWQLHAVGHQQHVDHAFGEGRVIETMELARKQGKVRFLGFTGHRDPDVHLAMLAHKYPFDACQLPLSAIDANSDAFVRRVLPVVLEQKIAPLAMKTLGGNGAPIRAGVLTSDEALRYAWSLPVTLVVSGITSLAELRANVQSARAFKPMSPDEMLALETRIAPASKSDRYEPYRHWYTYRDGDALRGAI